VIIIELDLVCQANFTKNVIFFIFFPIMYTRAFFEAYKEENRGNLNKKGIFMGKKETVPETINERVKKIRKFLGITQQEFADKIKLKTGNTFSMIERGENTVTEQNILIICTTNQLKNGLTVNEQWLRTGQGEMFIAPAQTDGIPKLFENGKELPADEEELIGVYRDLFPENKKLIRHSAKTALAAQENTINEISPAERGERRSGELKKSG